MKKRSQTIECRTCGDEFTSFKDKPGFIDQCEACAVDVPKVGGNMVWAHKTAPELEIKSMVEAKAFAKKQRRLGVGVTSCLVQSKNLADPAIAEASKQKSGTEDRALYYSRLGEKRSVKL